MRTAVPPHRHADTPPQAQAVYLRLHGELTVGARKPEEEAEARQVARTPRAGARNLLHHVVRAHLIELEGG